MAGQSDPNVERAKTALIIGVVILLLTTGLLAYALYQKMSH